MPAFLVLLGALVGGYGTLIGAGGGFVLMPALLFLYPREPLPALTSLSLSVVALNALSGTIAYARARRIDYRLAAIVAGVSVPAGVAGAALTHLVPRRLFEGGFGAVLLALGVTLVLRPIRKPPTPTTEMDVPPPPVYAHMALGLTLCALFGLLSGLLGIGGAPPQVVVLTEVMQVPVTTAMPTVQCVVLFAAVAGVVTHAVTAGYHPGLPPLVFLGVGAVLGAQGGAALARRLSSATLLRLLAGALFVIGTALILKALA